MADLNLSPCLGLLGPAQHQLVGAGVAVPGVAVEAPQAMQGGLGGNGHEGEQAVLPDATGAAGSWKLQRKVSLQTEDGEGVRD